MDRYPNRDKDKDANKDPITGAPGAHPVGVGTGAAGGGVTGAVIGTAAGGPVGAAVGAVVGGIAGGLAGKGIAEAVNPTEEHEYWRGEYTSRPYWSKGATYDDYGPAYEYGWNSYGRYAPQNRSFEEVESDLERGWESFKDKSKLTWLEAKEAARDAWKRIERDRRDGIRD